MNSLNILSGRASPAPSSIRSRASSLGNVLPSVDPEVRKKTGSDLSASAQNDVQSLVPDYTERGVMTETLEEQCLSNKESPLKTMKESVGWSTLPKHIASVLLNSVRWLLSAVASPGIYLLTLLYDDQQTFAPFASLFRATKSPTKTSPNLIAIDENHKVDDEDNEKHASTSHPLTCQDHLATRSNMFLTKSLSESENEQESPKVEKSPRTSKSDSARLADEISPARRSIRIKLHNEESLRQRNQRKSQILASSLGGSAIQAEITPAALKSPTSTTSALSMTRYPRMPAPPRPLVPRRHPSFSTHDNMHVRGGQKTLVLDLDETLIHSMAKGGRMGTGHMVEVRLNTMVGTGNTATAGPQHPILYYVHKRPHCDDFLRKICKWYNLVIFTASVQEYADPVIDWLEQERKLFSGRFYRQHCTYRHNAFIKDLSYVEPDLSKVMILDNSPLSYMFHQDNAIPIEGWINDPSDNDLLHLVPLLEALQHVTDVRAFLALRGGEDGKHV